MRSFCRPTRSISWTPTIVIIVLTRSAMILNFRNEFRWGEEGRREGDGLDEESVAYSGLEEECLCFDVS